MTHEPSAARAGTIEYPAEGFRVHWCSRGIEITVTEYHAGKLRLDWSTLLRLAHQAAVPDERDC